MIGRPAMKYVSNGALQSAGHAPVEAKWEDIRCKVSPFTRPDILET